MIYLPIALRLLSKKARKGEKQTIARGNRQVCQKRVQLEFCLLQSLLFR
jgi:hypothetical protein